MTQVLVVDDSPVDRLLAGRLIEKLGDTQVVYAENGRAALDQIEAHIPDLVVTDMQMPEMDGFELVEALKHAYPLIPVILMTAAGSEEIAVKALQAGAASYVPKASLVNDLADTVWRVITMSHARHSQTRLLSRVQRATTEFQLENDRELMRTLASYLQQQFAGMKICGESDGLRVGVALEEALLNAFYHGNLEISSQLREESSEAYTTLATKRCGEMPYMSRRIFVTSILARDEASWVIRDEGPGFDPTTLPDPTAPEYLERPHGRGLMLMRTFMSEVHYNSQGNEVRMVKRRA